MGDLLVSEPHAIYLTLAAIGAFGTLTSIEYLYALKNGTLGTNSLFAWDLCRSRTGWPFRGTLVRLLDICFQDGPFSALMVARLALSLTLFVVHDRTALAIILLLLSFFQILLTMRHSHGHDGADQMSLLLTVGAMAYFLFDGGSPWRWAGIIFIGLQAVLSYSISGLAKMSSPVWRSGQGLYGVMITTIYGTPSVGRVLRKHPLMCRAFAWALMIWQVTTPVLVFSGSLSLSIWLLLGMSFHISAALFMGLNSFLLAFVGSYPSVFLTSVLIRAAVGDLLFSARLA
jgi:hypothetical protein